MTPPAPAWVENALRELLERVERLETVVFRDEPETRPEDYTTGQGE